MGVYLKDIPLKEAIERLQASLVEHNLAGVLGEEVLALSLACVGRVLAQPVWAKLSSPHYHASAMDGFALKSSLTVGAADRSPKEFAIPSEAKYVDTGDPLPMQFDAVIPIERVEALDVDGEITAEIRNPARVRFRAAVPPWQHVRPMGEDIVATELVLPAGHKLRPVDLGAIAASGHTEVIVTRKPKIGVIPTGTELVPIGQTPKPGEILEYNALMMAAQVEQAGGEAKRYPIVPDDFEQIRSQVVAAAKENDFVLLNAGSSAGAEDFSAKVVESLGELLVHGVAVRPGHPVIIGTVKIDEKVTPIIGVPGYPVSAALTVEIFLLPVLAQWMGQMREAPETIEATINTKLTSPAGDDDFIRVVLGEVDGKLMASPLARGAGVITSLVRADGLALIPAGIQGVDAGDAVNVQLYSRRSQLNKTIFAVGSHDMLLDVLAQELAKHDRRLVSANVGSLAGLVALNRGETHIAGSHLLDPETGEYNLPYMKRYMRDKKVTGLTLANRVQGLIVPKGNPRGIRALDDLTRDDIRFVNRQRGAGTRVLLDYQLEQTGINADKIAGYAQEEYTHLSVAAAVASGRADCGMGIQAAAEALLMDFIPLYHERYDIIIPLEIQDSDLLAPLFDVLHSEKFKKIVSSRPGYEASQTGQVAFRWE